ncbi:hypothetical protein GQ44DRAFT_832867 [Phaeosphaeriaceae sp. PMI808]|nr:hypothetical protein GQ44DRAFT_832867 [Phaeosphaeriaceae sp. PMI808]
MPLVPMPRGAIYVPFVYMRGKGNTGGLENAKDRELPIISSHLIESSINTKYNIPNPVESLLSKQRCTEQHDPGNTAHLRARPSAFSYAETTQAARRPAVTYPKTVSEIASVVTAEPKAIVPTPKLNSITTEQLPARSSISVIELHPTGQISSSVVSPVPSAQAVAPKPKNVIASDESLISVYADPDTILARAEELRNNIITALTSDRNSVPTICNSKPMPDHLPFVSKWAEYSKKYGIGYVLANGNVGVVANHTDDKPLVHTVVDHGCIYLKTIYDSRTLKAVPFTFFMQADDGSLEDLNEQMPIRTKEKKEQPLTIVRYYQRVGNVSVWGFSNGCFQFNFPDHTKFVLSADGKYASFTLLPLSAIEHITNYSTNLPLDFIKAREVVSNTIRQLLYGTQPMVNLTSKPTSPGVEIDFPDLTIANALPAKLRFVVEMVGCWVSGGGLGCKLPEKKWPVWDGTTLEDAWGSKLDWVTVGRFSGGRASKREKDE